MPIFIHAILGVRYLFTSKDNVVSSDGSRPSLGRYAENRFYRWQRITSWILLLAIFGHVVQMRFINYPDHVKYLDKTYYLTTVSGDSGLLPLSKKLHFKLFDAAEIEAFLKVSAAKYQSYISGFKNLRVASSEQKELTNWYQTIEKFQLNSNERLILTSSFGTAVLMMVRDTFKSPLMIFLYSIFVIAACFHAFNGMWTAFISWGISLSKRSQNIFRALFMFLMTLLTFLGLAAIWLTYYVNLF